MPMPLSRTFYVRCRFLRGSRLPFSAARREFYRIGEQVDDHLLYGAHIGIHRYIARTSISRMETLARSAWGLTSRSRITACTIELLEINR